MVWTRNAWNNFKAQPEIWFFYGFILTIPLSIRKVFFDYPVLGGFNEYTGAYLYLSDILFVGMLAAWIISILYNKYITLSICSGEDITPRKKCSAPKGMFHPSTNVPPQYECSTWNIIRGRRGTSYGAGMEYPTGQAWNILRGDRRTIYILVIPLILVAWSFLSIKWSNNASIALYRSFKLFEFYLLYLFLALNLRCSTPARLHNFLRSIFSIIIVVGLINAIIAIIQVVLQHSLGLFWLKESLISPDLPGVAKVILGETKFIRAYGLFPHPNILGGFLFLSIMLTLAYRQLFHFDTNVPSQKKCSTPEEMFHMEHPTGQAWNILRFRHGSIWKILLLLQAIGLIVTFSKSALVGLLSALAYLIYIKKVPPQKECSVWNILRGKRGTMEQLKLAKRGLFEACRHWGVFVTGLIFGVLAFIFRPNLNSLFFQSLNERVFYLDIAKKMIFNNPLFGIGFGQFVVNMQAYTNQLLLDWQFQPVHNVFLLIRSELGLIGLSLFGWFLWKLFHPSSNVPHGTSYGAGVKQTQYKCSTPEGMFHMEHPTGQAWNILWGRRETGRLKYNFQEVFKALLIGFFVIALFDHYLWDIQQGQIILWVVLGLLVGSRLNT